MMNAEEMPQDPRNLYDLIREFTQTLRLLRLQKNLTIGELAKRAGRSKSLVAMLERGRRIITYPTYVCLCRALALEGDELTAFKKAATDILVFRTLYGRSKEPYVRRAPTSAEVALLNWRDRLVVQTSETHRAELAKEILAISFKDLPAPRPVPDADRGEPPVFSADPPPSLIAWR